MVSASLNAGMMIDSFMTPHAGGGSVSTRGVWAMSNKSAICQRCVGLEMLREEHRRRGADA